MCLSGIVLEIPKCITSKQSKIISPCRVPLRKLTVPQLITKICIFKIKNCTKTFKEALCLFLARLIKSTQFRIFLKISFNGKLPLTPSCFQWYVSFNFTNKIIHASHLCAIHATYPAHLILLYLIMRLISGDQYRPRSPSSCNLL